MHEKRFEELFTDIERWVRQARRLKAAGDLFIETISYLDRRNLSDIEGFESQSPEFLEAHDQSYGFVQASALLHGLAIENVCKARQIRDKHIIVQCGEAKNLRSDHNLLAMVNEAKYTPNQDESYFLERLTYQVQVLARYSIAKKCSTQFKFTGVIVGGSSHDSQMVHSIIIKVLKDQDLVDIFTYGYLPKPIGE